MSNEAFWLSGYASPLQIPIDQIFTTWSVLTKVPQSIDTGAKLLFSVDEHRKALRIIQRVTFMQREAGFTLWNWCNPSINWQSVSCPCKALGLRAAHFIELLPIIRSLTHKPALHQTGALSHACTQQQVKLPSIIQPKPMVTRYVFHWQHVQTEEVLLE